MQDISLVKRLLFDLNIFVYKRYGKKPATFFWSILLTRFLLKYCSKLLLLYLHQNEVEENKNLLPDKKNQKYNGKVKNLKIKIKKFLSLRAGHVDHVTLTKLFQIISKAANFVELNTDLITVFTFLTKLVRTDDLYVSVYDIYHQTPVLQGGPNNICADQNLGFSYLLLIFDDPHNLISVKDKKDQIYKVIFENGTLKSSKEKGEFFMRMFITCAVIFCLKFRNLGGHGPTLLAFFEALMEALKKKKISKPLARLLIRRLRKYDIPIPPELEEIVNN